MAKYINEMTQNIVVHKKSAFNWSFLLVFIGPFIASTLLASLSLAGISHPPNWLNWILAIIFIPLILISLIISQRRELIGAYGETILLLIPTFVWLLPGHEEAKKYIIVISSIIILFGFAVYSFGMLIKFIKPVKEEHYESRRKVVEVFLRIGFISASVTSTLIISIIMINYGDFALDLAHTKGKDKPDYSGKHWITFISVVTIFVALTLVILGLITGAKEKLRKSFQNKEFGFEPYDNKNTKNIKLKNSITNTVTLRIKNRRWYNRWFKKKKSRK